MWPSRTRTETVTCIACGDAVARDDAREYDRYGDRWDRAGKEFEYLCKPCDNDRCHRSRDGLEALLVDCGAGEHTREAFLERYLAAVEEHDGTVEGS